MFQKYLNLKKSQLNPCDVRYTCKGVAHRMIWHILFVLITLCLFFKKSSNINKNQINLRSMIMQILDQLSEAKITQVPPVGLGLTTLCHFATDFFYKNT
jgi:hypothetical protein